MNESRNRVSTVGATDFAGTRTRQPDARVPTAPVTEERLRNAPPEVSALLGREISSRGVSRNGVSIPQLEVFWDCSVEAMRLSIHINPLPSRIFYSTEIFTIF